MSEWQQAREEVLETARRMVEKGLVVGNSGNVSLRLPARDGRELLAITPSRRDYDLLRPEDVPVIDFDTEPVEGDLVPSVESLLHIGIYRARPKVGAVIHTHPVYASIIAVAGLEIPPILDDQVVFLGGEIKLARYAVSGSDEMVASVIEALGERNAVLLPNHGAVGAGRDLREAFTNCELLEKTAKIYFGALSLGKVNPLPGEALEAARAFYNLLQSGPG